jgi:Anti-sigma-K factor rskA
LSLTEPHNEFLELCAVSTSGRLTEEEHKKLQEHLAVCLSCRESLKQYEAVVSQAIPAFAANKVSDDLEPGPDWSEEQVEHAILDRLEQEQRGQSKKSTGPNEVSTTPHYRPPFSSESVWHHVWMLYAASILLLVSLSFYAYRVGVRRGTANAKLDSNQPTALAPASPERRPSAAGHERQVARDKIDPLDEIIAQLRQQSAQQFAEINGLKAAKDRFENSLRADTTTRQDLVQQRSELAQKLDAAMSSSQALQQKLDSLAGQAAQDAGRIKVLDSKVNDLNRLIRERDVAIDQKDELLAHDRDIRELMGARDLYIAEVHDVTSDGQTQIPYGRVFYTKGKSLIFYAYDLDQQTATKTANAFQVWGRRGPDQQKAVNLGVFYEDNASKKRWVLKCDNPETLAQIDAVFVTVEPGGGSQKPSGKSLLFAYLGADSNHP